MANFLMIYVNDAATYKVPNSILTILSYVEKSGHNIDLFDNTKYGISIDINDHTLRAKMLNFEVLDMEPYGVTYDYASKEEINNDLTEKIKAFKPDIIGISITEETSKTGFQYAEHCKKMFPKIPVILGGIYCMIRPEIVIANPAVDMICVGEGEVAVKELLDKIDNNETYDRVPNLWIKKAKGEIIKNDIHAPLDLNLLAYPDL